MDTKQLDPVTFIQVFDAIERRYKVSETKAL